MSCSLNFHVPKALPSITPLCRTKISSSFNSSEQRPSHNPKLEQTLECICLKPNTKTSTLAIPLGAILVTVAQPAFAVTGVNYEEDLTSILIQSGISAFLYFIVSPPIIMNWLRIRRYKRNLVEMYFQFMFVFIFFPGLMLWAPFLNFRQFPRDPSLKYPWSTPENPSQVRGGFLKYPWAKPEDYE